MCQKSAWFFYIKPQIFSDGYQVNFYDWQQCLKPEKLFFTYIASEIFFFSV